MKKLLITAALCTAFSAVPAAAQMYVGGGIGASRTDTTEKSWKLYSGFQFSPTWGMELAYNDLGRYRNADIKSWTFAGTGTLPLGANWSLLGKLGVAANRPRFAGAANKSDLLAGIGLGYNFTPKIGLRLEYEDFGRLSKSPAGADSRGQNVGLSVNYKF